MIRPIFIFDGLDLSDKKNKSHKKEGSIIKKEGAKIIKKKEQKS
jgi:hypothetical protein